MATIQDSIEVNVPITRLYVQLIQFEDYPRFLQHVERVEKTDLRHLHWTVRKDDRLMEWDAELTEQEENRHIVWHNAHDHNDAARIDLDELGPNLSKVSFTLDTVPGRFPGISAGDTAEEVARGLRHDLTSLKEFLEGHGSRFDARGIAKNSEESDGLDAQEQADAMNAVRQPTVCRTASSMSGSPTGVLDDEPNESGVDAMLNSGASAGRTGNRPGAGPDKPVR